MFLKLEIIKKIYGIVLLIVSMKHGVMAIALSGLANAVISLFVNAYPNGKLLNYKFREQMKDLMPAILLSMTMGVGVYIVGRFIENELLRIGVQVVTGGIMYIALSFLFRVESFQYLLHIVIDRFDRREKVVYEFKRE